MRSTDGLPMASHQRQAAFGRRQNALAAVTACGDVLAPAAGLGSDVRLSGAGITGAARLATDHVLHLIAFAV